MLSLLQKYTWHKCCCRHILILYVYTPIQQLGCYELNLINLKMQLEWSHQDESRWWMSCYDCVSIYLKSIPDPVWHWMATCPIFSLLWEMRSMKDITRTIVSISSLKQSIYEAKQLLCPSNDPLNILTSFYYQWYNPLCM